MKPGQASMTAELVCMGRAIADGRTPAFSDPTALPLLSDRARERVQRVRSGVAPKGLRESVIHGYLARQAKVMVARTMAIDDAVRAAAAPELVILGAGLDGRAWRMRELADAIVFEVDHPDTQREKRARTGALTQAAREVRFVPVDFARDDLDAALSAAGHDPTRPTTWIWEGVVMYLDRAAISATLDVVARRSTSGSHLIILYHAPAPVLRLVGLLVRRVGEPLRSAFTDVQMRALLAEHDFDVVRDRSIPEVGAELSAELGKAASVAKHLRVVTAARR